jgi:predicted P-loop ATPase
VWLIEMSELDALTRAGNSAIKSFLTRRHDRYRPPYGTHVIERPRQCVFAGTINPAGGYLKDPTGTRRFWPVACNTVDLDPSFVIAIDYGRRRSFDIEPVIHGTWRPLN